MTELRIMMHWSVNSFKVSLWYSPGEEELEFEGALCDCDHWDTHQTICPAERTCPHIARVRAYIDTVEKLGHADDRLIEDSIELDEIEEVAAPRVSS